MKHFAFAATMALFGCAPLPTAAPDAKSARLDDRTCFSTAFADGFETIGRQAIRVRVGVGQKYDIQFSGGQCDQLEWSHKLAIETQGTSQLCTGGGPRSDSIYFRDPTSRRLIECHIDEVLAVPTSEKR